METSKSERPDYTRNNGNVNTIGSQDENINTLTNLIRSYVSHERARITLSFLPYFKPSKLAEITHVDRQLIDWWIKKYPQFVKKGGENK